MFLDKFQKSRGSLAVFGRKLLEKRKNFKVEINNKLQSDLDKMKSNVIKNITRFESSSLKKISGDSDHLFSFWSELMKPNLNVRGEII